jgi:hypothetical protein
MVKKLMRPRVRSISAAPPAVHGSEVGLPPCLLGWTAEKATGETHELVQKILALATAMQPFIQLFDFACFVCKVLQ